jgi:predicted RND superfamily exporter protein
MEKLSHLILRNKMIILIIFITLFVISIFFISHVKINYNLSDYLPKDTQSLKATNEILKSYDTSIPNVKLMIPKVSISEAIKYKTKIMNIKGVNTVLWADNYFNLLDTNNIDISDWYKNNDALFLINIKTDNGLKTIDQIKDTVKDNSLLAGDAVNTATVQHNVMSEMNNIMLFAVPIIFIILLLTTSSWF